MNKPKWELLKADRSWSNESNGAEMAGCISDGGRVVAYIPNHFKDAPLLCAAPELLEALEALLADAVEIQALRQSIHQRNGTPFTPSTKIEQARAAIAKAKGEA